jgi:hypothetical protein
MTRVMIRRFPTETREELAATVRHVRQLWDVTDRLHRSMATRR